MSVNYVTANPITLAADVADAGTFTVNYPSGYTAGDFSAAVGHYIMMNGTKLRQPADIGLSFGTSSVTVTNRTGGTLPSGASVIFEFRLAGGVASISLDGGSTVDYLADNVTGMEVVTINLGSPITADADGVCASQSGTEATAMTLNGALLANSVMVFDVPRNVVATWTGTAVLTIVGKDVYGRTMVESSASGTSLAGVKAFKEITSVTPSANITSATVGTGDVLGLPFPLVNGAADILKETLDNAAATAGTTVAALAKNTESTATTADVFGTYDPNSACDGARAFRLVVVRDAAGRWMGNPQYAG